MLTQKIQISDKEREALIAYHRRNIERINEEIKELEEERAESENRLAEFSPFESPTLFVKVNLKSYYDNAWSAAKKTYYILKNENILLTTREIATTIKEQEPDNESRIGEIVSQLASTLKQKIDKDQEFGRIEINGVQYYGLKEWFNPDGSVDSVYIKK